jgi:uncharacterized protein (TIGR02391 family)
MNVETNISEGLWQEIRQNYEEGRFTDAIKDAMFHLSEIIREKANLEGDGLQLVGDAFGGSTPRIRVTKLQSENEKNIQRGVEAILRGLYQAVRNPRSHEKYTDSKQDADAILLFVDYLLRVISQSRAQFTLETYLPRVFDNSFVQNRQYADLLTSEIPAKRCMEVMLAVLQKKEQGDGAKLLYFFRSLLARLEQSEQAETYQRISEELQLSDEFVTIRTVIQILEPSHWPKLQVAARMRIENKLIESIAEGAYNQATGKCSPGGLGTWATRLFPFFTLKSQAANAIMSRLFSDSVQAQDYALKFLGTSLPSLLPVPSERLKKHLIEKLNKGDKRFYDLVGVFDFAADDAAWTEPFKDSMAKFVAAEEPAPEQDDVPF